MTYALDASVRALAAAIGDDMGEVKPNVRKANFAADRAPLPSDDASQGYAVGSRWQAGGREWVLVDASAGAAAWDEATRYDVASLPDLLASRRSYPIGSTITTRAEGAGFVVADADPDVTMAGGVYLRARWRDGGFDIRQFGAKLNGVADDTQAFQRACDRAVGETVNVVLPPETIRLDGRVTLDLSSYTAETDEKGVSILGAGRGVTELIQGTAGAGITVLGGTTGAAMHHHVTLADFKVNGFDNAILLKNAAFMDLRNIFSIGGDLAVKLEDVLSCRFTNVYARFGKRGLHAQARQTFTNPNALTFYGCHFGKMSAYGARFENPAGVAFYGGSFEGCGSDTAETARGAVILSGAGVAGGVGLLSSGVYYEGNGGPADVQIAQGIYNCDYDFYGNLFNRVGTAAVQSTRNILLTTAADNGRATLNTRNAYRDFGGFVPTATEPYIQIIDGGDCAVWNDLGDTFTTTDAWPAQNGGNTRAMCVFNGTLASPTPDGDKNVKSISKIGTGEYQLTFKHPIPTGNRAVTIGLNAPGHAYLFGESQTGVTVRTMNAASALTDFSRISVSVVR